MSETTEKKELKPATQEYVARLIKSGGITLNADATSEVDKEIFTKTLPEGKKAEDIVDAIQTIQTFTAATAKVLSDQALPHIEKDPNFSAEVQIPLAGGHRVNFFIEGSKEVSTGTDGGRQTVHGVISNKLEIRGWKAGDFGQVRKDFREKATALLNK